MMPFRWGKVAIQYSRYSYKSSRLGIQPHIQKYGKRQFHKSYAFLKDNNDPKDPHDSEGPHDNKEIDPLLNGKDSRKKPEKNDEEKQETAPKDSSKGSLKAKSTKENNPSDVQRSEDNENEKSVDKSNISSWNPPSSVDNVERKRRVLMNQQKRRNRKSNMFNPKEFEEGGSDAPPITTQERLLPIQLPFRPVYPGASTYMVSGDTQLMNVLRKLNETPGWDHRIIAVMSKTPIKTAQLITNVDDVHEIGCVCLVDNISISRIPDTDRYSAYAAVFPMFRARVGELVENVKANVESARAPSGKETDSALDQVTVQYMKGITAVPNEPYAVADDEIQRQCVRIIDSLREISSSSSVAKRLVDEFSTLVPQSPGGVFPQPDFLADFTASIMPKNDALQKVLSETNVLNRLKMVSELASKEVMYLRVQEGIARYGHNQTELRNREMILNEYLRYIKKELGIDGDDKSKSADKYLDRAANLDMPSEVRSVFDEELNKFRSLEPTSGEYNTVRSYLDWLTSLPWGKYTSDRFDLKEARRLLDNSHYGMKEVKDRILEFLAVGKLNGTVDGKIVCLAGPPGVGKTSIAKSIAEALNRKFDRFSVGGLHDASEIKGHRRTYVAAMPGRIIQALKRTQTQNPVILIDEIDKIGAGGAHGSPSAALLEVLDPEQNKNFQDTYLEVPMDLSRVLFLCTANYLENIPAPLMDRMEIINVPGYLPDEKVQIATSHLAPKSQREAGLGAADVSFDKDALRWLVQKYTREAGVRGLSKNIEKIFRKVAIGLVSQEEIESKEKEAEQKTSVKASTAATSPAGSGAGTADTANANGTATTAKPAEADANDQELDSSEKTNEIHPLHDKVGKFSIKIGRKDIQKYVGPPVHNADRLYEVLPVGVSMGLGWSPNGGMPLFIESVLQEPLTAKSKARFTRTGQLGEVMGESTSIAYSFARMFMARNFPRNRFLDHAVVHTHFPEGALKKDGPSAGITTATSLLSLAMNLPVHNDVAMTGELSLTGKVLQIGGLREKAIAAKTAGAKIIIFPDDNRAEWEDLPEEVRKGLDARPVKHYQDVFDIVFGSVDAAKVNCAWPELKEEGTKDEKERSIPAKQVPI